KPFCRHRANVSKSILKNSHEKYSFIFNSRAGSDDCRLLAKKLAVKSRRAGARGKIICDQRSGANPAAAGRTCAPTFICRNSSANRRRLAASAFQRRRGSEIK